MGILGCFLLVMGLNVHLIPSAYFLASVVLKRSISCEALTDCLARPGHRTLVVLLYGRGVNCQLVFSARLSCDDRKSTVVSFHSGRRTSSSGSVALQRRWRVLELSLSPLRLPACGKPC